MRISFLFMAMVAVGVLFAAYPQNATTNSTLSPANQTLLNTAISNEAFTGLLVSNTTVPAVNYTSASPLNYSAEQGVLSNLTIAASGEVILHGNLACPHSILNPTCNDFLKIYNIINRLPYGSIPRANGYVTPGNSNYYIAIDNTTGQIDIYNDTIIPAVPKYTLSVDGAVVSATNQSIPPQIIHVPLINGAKTYNIIATLTGSNLNPITYGYNITAANGTLLKSGTVTAYSTETHFTFTLPNTTSATINFWAISTTDNYTSAQHDPVMVPTVIAYYIPITLTNYQNVGVLAGTPIAIGGGVSPLPNPTWPFSSTHPFDPIYGFPANSYQSYEASNLDNAEFFFANGTIATSWLEGNLLNEAQTTNLYTSSNIVYWVVDPSNSFLPANTGTATTNTIYLGWAPTSTNVFDGVSTGEAPQLSPSYGQYDNGQNVFTIYTGFAGTSPPSGWTVENNLWVGYIGSSDTTITFSNGITVALSPSGWVNGGGIFYTAGVTPANEFITDTYVTSRPTDGSYQTYSPGMMGDSSSGYGYFVQPTGTTFWRFSGTGLFGCCGGGGPEDSYQPDVSAPYISSITWPVFDTQYTELNYSLQGHSAIDESYSSTQYPSLGVWSYAMGSSGTSQWIRVRIVPPNEIMPASSYGGVSQNYAIYPITFSPSSTVRQGVAVTLSSLGAHGGTAPYTYQWFVECPTCGSYNAIPSATTANYVFTTTSSTALGNWNYILQATDSMSTVANSLPGTVNVQIGATVTCSAAVNTGINFMNGTTYTNGETQNTLIIAATQTNGHVTAFLNNTANVIKFWSITAPVNQNVTGVINIPPSWWFEFAGSSSPNATYVVQCIPASHGGGGGGGGNSSIKSLVISSGTVYMNLQSSPLFINIDSSGNSQGYVGSTSGSLIQVYNTSETLYGTVGAYFYFNISSFMIVPPGYYYKIVYSGPTEFVGTYSSFPSGGGGGGGGISGFIALPELGMNSYSGTALIMFGIGIVLFIILLLNIFNEINLWKGTFVGGIAHMVLGFGVVIMLLSAGFYTEIINVPPYTITTGSSITTVATNSIVSLPLVTQPIFAVIIYSFCIVAAVIGAMGLYFFVFMFNQERKAKKARMQNG